MRKLEPLSLESVESSSNMAMVSSVSVMATRIEPTRS